MSVNQEIQKRRTFAIISHPDAGKTTLTGTLISGVKDNGRGIKKEDLSKVFTPYFTTKSTGTGIGLFLVKQIVENHNGTISFETKENKGTTFSLVIPKTGN